MLGITMHHVKEYEIKFILENLNLKPSKTYLRFRQLHFLTLITHMDPTCLSRQGINSQATEWKALTKCGN
jgi:hypothetical protein